MTARLAITGTDGTGKTTVIRRLRARYADRPAFAQAFRAPQYHENPDLPFGRLSAIIDATSEFADRQGNLGLKATALFLSMTLFGDVESHLETAFHPRWIISERQCLCDSLAYAMFYLPLMQSPLDEARLRGPLDEALTALDPKALTLLERWTAMLPRRLGESGDQSFWHLPLFMRDLFSLPSDVLVPKLQALYHAQTPDRIVVLTANSAALAARLTQKAGGTTPKELHEQTHVLAMFQEGLTRSAEALKQVKPALQVVVMDTSEQSPEETEAALAREIGA